MPTLGTLPIGVLPVPPARVDHVCAVLAHIVYYSFFQCQGTCCHLHAGSSICNPIIRWANLNAPPGKQVRSLPCIRILLGTLPYNISSMRRICSTLQMFEVRTPFVATPEPGLTELGPIFAAGLDDGAVDLGATQGTQHMFCRS